MKSKFGQKCVQTSDFTVKGLMKSNSLNCHNFQTVTDIRVKICSYAKACTQNKILNSKMQNLNQHSTSTFAPLTSKRWIAACWKRTLGDFISFQRLVFTIVDKSMLI